MAIDGVNGPVNTGRRRFLTATTAVVGAVGAGIAAVPFIKSWNPSARAKLAGAPVSQAAPSVVAVVSLALPPLQLRVFAGPLVAPQLVFQPLSKIFGEPDG